MREWDLQPELPCAGAASDCQQNVCKQADIDMYVASGEPFGKAGGYGIQGCAGAFVQRIDGCYNNVVGFPLHAFAARVSQLLQDGLL